MSIRDVYSVVEEEGPVPFSELKDVVGIESSGRLVQRTDFDRLVLKPYHGYEAIIYDPDLHEKDEVFRLFREVNDSLYDSKWELYLLIVNHRDEFKQVAFDQLKPFNNNYTESAESTATCPFCGKEVKKLPYHLPCNGVD